MMMVMAYCTGLEVNKDTISRLHGYGCVLLVVKSPAWIHLSSRLFSRFARTSFSFGLRALANSHEIRWFAPLVLDIRGRIFISGPVLWVLMRR